jgi:hypothetical protein
MDVIAAAQILPGQDEHHKSCQMMITPILFTSLLLQHADHSVDTISLYRWTVRIN